VDWARVAGEVPAEVVMQLGLARPRPGALLWVLDGDEFWNGRLYEVDQAGRARFVTLATWDAEPGRYQALWPNVTPVTWALVHDLYRRGEVGAPV
jgi:hypothetical protein